MNFLMTRYFKKLAEGFCWGTGISLVLLLINFATHKPQAPREFLQNIDLQKISVEVGNISVLERRIVVNTIVTNQSPEIADEFWIVVTVSHESQPIKRCGNWIENLGVNETRDVPVFCTLIWNNISEEKLSAVALISEI